MLAPVLNLEPRACPMAFAHTTTHAYTTLHSSTYTYTLIHTDKQLSQIRLSHTNLTNGKSEDVVGGTGAGESERKRAGER